MQCSRRDDGAQSRRTDDGENQGRWAAGSSLKARVEDVAAGIAGQQRGVEWLAARLGYGSVASTGLVLLALAVQTATGAGTRLAWLPTLTLTAMLAAIGRWVDRERPDGFQALRLGCWFVGAVLVFACSFALFVTAQETHGGVIVGEQAGTVAFAAWGGSLGLLLGWHDVRRDREARRAAAAHRRSRRFGQKVTVLNRVLRHDIRTGVQVIELHLQRIAESVDAPDDHLDAVREELDELVDLSDVARHVETLKDRDQGDEALIDVGSALRDCVAEAVADRDDVTVETDLEPSREVRAHQLLPVAFEEVIENAVEHNDGRARVAVRTRQRPGGSVEVRIADDGPGLPENERQVLTGRDETPLQHASGVGLWLTRWIVTASGGSLSIEERDPEGTVVVMRLPPADRRFAGPADDGRPGTDRHE